MLPPCDATGWRCPPEVSTGRLFSPVMPRTDVRSEGQIRQTSGANGTVTAARRPWYRLPSHTRLRAGRRPSTWYPHCSKRSKLVAHKDGAERAGTQHRQRLPGQRALRQQRGLSQADLARRAGLTPVFVNRVELQRQKARGPSVKALAAAPGVRPEALTAASAAEKEGED